MPVITINGPIGAGPAPVVGQLVADLLGLNFVDRLVFTTAARMMGTPVGALIDKEQRVVRFRDRLGRLVQTMLERSAVSGVSAEPYFGRGLETLPPEIYNEMTGSATSTPQVDDKVFIEATTTVVKDLYRQGNVVIIGRGANVILADATDVLHVGLLAPMEARVETMMGMEHLERDDAQADLEELDKARQDFFRKFFKARPNDPDLFHLMLNMGRLQTKTAAEIIVHAIGDLRP
jgi:cytidylate kinase